MALDPDIPDAHSLRGWYDSVGSNVSYRSQSSGGGGVGAGGNQTFDSKEAKPINIIQDTLLGLGDKPDYFSTRVTVLHVKSENLFYTACPGASCSKKVMSADDGSWRCEKCNRSYDHCEYR